MASIEQRGKTWTVRYRDAAGRQLRQSGFRTKADAKSWANEREAEQRAGVRVDRSLTFSQFAQQYLDQHHASPSTIGRIEAMLKHANDAFGDTPLVELSPQRIGAWARSLSEGTRWDALRVVKQILKTAVEWRVLPHSPAATIKNPQPRAKDFTPFEDWAEVDAVEARMPAHYRGVVTFAVGTGMRPQEWTKLRWEHVDLGRAVLNLPASLTKDGRARIVPLRQRVVEMLARRNETRGLVFVDRGGKAIDIAVFRRTFTRAQKAAGVEKRRPYDMRHTYATWALRAGLNTFAVARRMGTSLEMIDRTYGHLATDSEDHERGLLDAFDMKPAAGHAIGHTGQNPVATQPASTCSDQQEVERVSVDRGAR